MAIETTLLGRETVGTQALGLGEVLGWSWLLPPYEWHYNARAARPTDVVVLDGKSSARPGQADHDVICEMMKRFALVIVQHLAGTRALLLHYPGSQACREGTPARSAG